MARSYGNDLRARVIGAVEQGASARSAAARFEIGLATAIRWARRWRETGDYRARPRGHPDRGSKLDAHEGFILGLIDRTPDITLGEIGARLAAERGLSASPATVWRFFDKRGITFKKNRARRRTAAPGRRCST